MPGGVFVDVVTVDPVVFASDDVVAVQVLPLVPAHPPAVVRVGVVPVLDVVAAVVEVVVPAPLRRAVVVAAIALVPARASATAAVRQRGLRLRMEVSLSDRSSVRSGGPPGSCGRP